MSDSWILFKVSDITKLDKEIQEKLLEGISGLGSVIPAKRDVFIVGEDHPMYTEIKQYELKYQIYSEAADFVKSILRA